MEWTSFFRQNQNMIAANGILCHYRQRVHEKVVQVPKIVEIEKIVPQLVNVNRYIQNIVERIVQVPIIIEQVKEGVR